MVSSWWAQILTYIVWSFYCLYTRKYMNEFICDLATLLSTGLKKRERSENWFDFDVFKIKTFKTFIFPFGRFCWNLLTTDHSFNVFKQLLCFLCALHCGTNCGSSTAYSINWTINFSSQKKKSDVLLHDNRPVVVEMIRLTVLNWQSDINKPLSDSSTQKYLLQCFCWTVWY